LLYAPAPVGPPPLKHSFAAGAALDEAAKLAADEAARARIAQERGLFDQLKALLADLRAAPRDAQPSKANPGM
jgi:hypothetical protein